QAESRFARDVWLWTNTLNWRFSPVLSGSFTFGLERGLFDDVFFEQLFDEPRADLAIRARGVLDWQFAPNWRLQYALGYRRNSTDVSVFEFDRVETSLGLQHFWQ
ncbi:MAG: hypothetical protein AAF610_08320, partial [Pseudomonadota bacterium]